MKKVVLSLGGSVLIPTLEEHRIARYAAVLKEIAGYARIYVVVGGGGEAQEIYHRCEGDSGVPKQLQTRSGSQSPG